MTITIDLIVKFHLSLFYCSTISNDLTFKLKFWIDYLISTTIALSFHLLTTVGINKGHESYYPNFIWKRQ